MKHILSMLMLLSSTILYAQNGNPPDTVSSINAKLKANEANNNPNISVTPAINTTVTNQPASMPNSNKNPTTGTVISLKNKNASKTNKPAGTTRPDSMPLLTKPDTTSANNRNKNKQGVIKKKK